MSHSTPRASFVASMENNGGRSLILNTQAAHRLRLLQIKSSVDTSAPASLLKRESILGVHVPEKTHRTRRRHAEPSFFSNYSTKQGEPLSKKKRPKTARNERRKSAVENSTKKVKGGVRGAQSARGTMLGSSIKQISEELDSLIAGRSEQRVTLNLSQQHVFDSFVRMLQDFSAEECSQLLREVWDTAQEQRLLARFGGDADDEDGDLRNDAQ